MWVQIITASSVQPFKKTVLRDDDFPGGYANARYDSLAKARIKYAPGNF
jgi:hypothetical protein